MYKIISGFAVMISSPENIEHKWKNWLNLKLGQTPSSFFFFCLRAHNQRVDYSGAYNWGCLLLYYSGKKSKIPPSSTSCSSSLLPFSASTKRTLLFPSPSPPTPLTPWNNVLPCPRPRPPHTSPFTTITIPNTSTPNTPSVARLV